MKVKIGIYSLFISLLIFESCSSSKKVIYFQSTESREGQVVDLPSYRNEKVIRFRPDDILGITVNIPGAPNVAADYNLPLIPSATSENSTESGVIQGVGRQGYLIKKDGTIDFPVVGNIKVSGYTQGELEDFLKEVVMRRAKVTPVITVRIMNFDVYVTGEVSRPGKVRIDKDNINILEVLSLAGDMTIYGRRDDILLKRQTPDGGYMLISLDISKEDIISSPYYFLQQNDELYVKPNNAKAQSGIVSPLLSVTIGVSSFLMSLVTFVLMLSRQ